MCFTNLIQVDTDLEHQHNSFSATQPLKDKPNKGLTYDSTALKTIHSNTKHDQRYKILPFGAITRIRELKINNRLSHKKTQPRIRSTPAGINCSSLVQVEISKENGIIHDTQLRIGTISIRSIRKNNQTLLREIIHLNLDIIIVTET